MSKFKHKSDQFVAKAEGTLQYPWESAFVKENPDISKHFTVSLSLEYYMKLEYIQNFMEERNRSVVVRDFLKQAIDKEITRIRAFERASS